MHFFHQNVDNLFLVVAHNTHDESAEFGGGGGGGKFGKCLPMSHRPRRC